MDLERLRERLTVAAKLYQSQNLEFQRTAVAIALHGVADLLEAEGFPPETLAPILRPALSLAERKNNNLDQMFAQRARGGRPRATIDDLERAGILAALANYWLRLHQDDGCTQSTKLAEAARKMRGHWFGKVTSANLKTARELVAQEAKDHPAVVIAHLFDDMFKDCADVASGEELFQLMIDYINENPASRMKGIWKTPPVSPQDDG